MSNNGRARKEEQAGHVTFLGEEGEHARDVPRRWGRGPIHALESAWRVAATKMAFTGHPTMIDSMAGKQESDKALTLGSRQVKSYMTSAALRCAVPDAMTLQQGHKLQESSPKSRYGNMVFQKV